MEKYHAIILGILLSSLHGFSQIEGPDGELLKSSFDSTLSETWTSWNVEEYSDYSGVWTTVDSSRSRNIKNEKSMATVTELRHWNYSKDSATYVYSITDWTNLKIETIKEGRFENSNENQ